MPRRKRFDVAPNRRQGGWTVKSGTKSESYATKQEARSAAVFEAKAVGNSQVVIRKKDGTIQEERTYGNDPRRTRG